MEILIICRSGRNLGKDEDEDLSVIDASLNSFSSNRAGFPPPHPSIYDIVEFESSTLDLAPTQLDIS